MEVFVSGLCGLIVVALPIYVPIVLLIPLLVVLSSEAYGLKEILTVGPARLYLYDLVLGAVVVKVAVKAIRRKSRPSSWITGGSVFQLALFFFVLIISTLISSFRAEAGVFEKEAISLGRLCVQAIIVPLCAVGLTDNKEISNAWRMLVLMSYIATATVIISYALWVLFGFQFGEIQIYGVPRYFGPIGDQAGFMCVLAMLRLLLARKPLLAIFPVVATLLTGTRGAIGMLVVSIVVLSIVDRRVFTAKALLTAGCAVFVSGLSWLAFGFVFGEDVFASFERFQDISEDTSFQQRQFAIQASFEAFLSSPLYGLGFTGLRHSFADYSWAAPTGLSMQNIELALQTSNNQILQILVDAGLVGLVCYAVLMKSSLMLLWQTSERADFSCRPFAKAVWVWVVALLIGNQSTSWLVPNSFIGHLLWVALGLCHATIINGSPQESVEKFI
jgi:hypothetical protein